MLVQVTGWSKALLKDFIMFGGRGDKTFSDESLRANPNKSVFPYNLTYTKFVFSLSSTYVISILFLIFFVTVASTLLVRRGTYITLCNENIDRH